MDPEDTYALLTSLRPRGHDTPRPGKENDSKAASASQIAPRTSSGLTVVRISNWQAEVAAPMDASIPLERQRHPPPVIYLDEVSTIRRPLPRSKHEGGRNDDEEDVLFRDSRNYPYNSVARAGTSRPPPPSHYRDKTHSSLGHGGRGKGADSRRNDNRSGDARARGVATPVNVTQTAIAPARGARTEGAQQQSGNR
jgi:hypothetical protein